MVRAPIPSSSSPRGSRVLRERSRRRRAPAQGRRLRRRRHGRRQPQRQRPRGLRPRGGAARRASRGVRRGAGPRPSRSRTRCAPTPTRREATSRWSSSSSDLPTPDAPIALRSTAPEGEPMSNPREVQLVSRPVGWPTPENFALVESAPRELAEGQIRVRNEVMSVDPYMRGRMSDAKSYAEPYALGEAMHGGAVGEVVESRAEGVAVGDHVLHGLGWREEAVLDATSARVVDTSVAPASAYLGVLGMTGLTAYAGLTRVAGLTEGDVVFVSGAAGAVGSAVGQIAKALGASRVIGSAGSAGEGRPPARRPRLRRGVQLQGRPRLRPAARGRPRRHRRLLRQRRRRPPRGGDRLAATRRPHRDLRRHLRLQQHRGRARPAQPRAAHPDPRHDPGLPRRRPLRPRGGVRPQGRRLDRRRLADLA